MKLYKISAIFLLFFCIQIPAIAAVYVNGSNTGTEDGTSWSTAYNTVQEGIDAASTAGGGDVWVAAGTYLVYNTSSGTGSASTIQMMENVNLYGGFDGSEESLAARDWEANTTTLDGNSQVIHVVTGASNAIIDGFTITGGNGQLGAQARKTPRAGTTVDAILSSGDKTAGGGILIFKTAPAVNNCIIDNNKALKGGGVYVMVSTDGNLEPENAQTAPTFTNCTFSNNSATGRGGGVANDVNSHPTFTGCKFISNTCDAKGGAMYNDWGCSPTLINCLIVKNEAARAAGMGNDGASSPKLINCTVADNKAYDIGAGIYTGSALNSTNDPTLINCIVWGNTNYYGGPTDLSGWHENHFYISFSDIGTGFDSYGTGILNNEDPLFTDADNGDYSLKSNSPCRDKGADSTIDSDIPADDLAGTARDSSPDMGAYEYTGTISNGTLTVTLSPDAAITDGAQWSVDGTSYASGSTASLSAGIYTVSFTTVTGYDTPVNQSVTIMAGGSKALTGTYTAQTGSLTVTITPADAVTAGAKWSIDSGATWNNSEAIQSGLIVGDYTVSFKTITGWGTPGSVDVSIANGQTASKSGAYTSETGSVTVSISPQEAIDAGAKWSVDGGVTWQDSGTIVSDLATGSQTITFNIVNLWETPADKSVTITAGQTESVSCVYTKTVYTLSDAVAILQMLCGMITQTSEFPDPSGDGVTGLEDVIYVLQYAAGLK